METKSNIMCARGLNNQSITTRNESKSQHRRQKRNRWTKEEEQPLMDLLKQSTTGCFDWEEIAKCPALAGRTGDQVREKWKGLKKIGPNGHGISSAHWSATEDDRVLELFERITEAGTVSGKLKLVAKAFPCRAQTAVRTRYYFLMRKQAEEEESDKNVLAVSVDDTLTTKCNTTNAAVIHKEENVQQFDRKRPSKGLLNHRELARSCGDDDGVDTGASDRQALDRSADNNCIISEHSSAQNAAAVAATGSSTSISRLTRSSNQRKRSGAVLVTSGVVKTRSALRKASKCDRHNSIWASLCPKRSEENFNAIIVSRPLFDDTAITPFK
jgi:hypothetical protein